MPGYYSDKIGLFTQDNHYHCPEECEHPQTFEMEEGELYCGCCWFEHATLTRMVICTPETCPDD